MTSQIYYTEEQEEIFKLFSKSNIQTNEIKEFFNLMKDSDEFIHQSTLYVSRNTTGLEKRSFRIWSIDALKILSNKTNSIYDISNKIKSQINMIEPEKSNPFLGLLVSHLILTHESKKMQFELFITRSMMDMA